MTLHLDPRMKLICLILVVINTMFFPSLEWESIWMIFICLFGIISGNGKRSILWGMFYCLTYLGWNLFLHSGAGISHAVVLAWLSLLFKLFPCCMMSGIIIRTTQINDFLTAMSQSYVPKQVIIPMAVLLLYADSERRLGIYQRCNDTSRSHTFSYRLYKISCNNSGMSVCSAFDYCIKDSG